MIKKLPSNLINQIAAGEVVDDPVSIIKELLENSIDAKSNYIKIIIENGGLNKIIVIDNGIGIKKNEISTAFERFATSKIKNVDDLNSISTLGFRGEALPSIASVSEVIIKSRSANSTLGYKCKITNGNIKTLTPSSIENGTYIEINKLFHNIPARKKFLKSEKYEYRKIINYVKTFCICNFNISIELYHNNKKIYNLKADSLINRISDIYDSKTKKSCLEVKFSKDDYKISGYIGNLSLVKKARINQYIFINDRPIKNQLISTSIFNAYRSLVSRGEYPFFILFLYLPKNKVDVNVHPKKQEVKFTNELQIQYVFNKSVSSALTDIFHTIPNFQKFNSIPIESEPLEISFNDSSLLKKESIVSLSSNGNEENYEDNLKIAEIRINKSINDKNSELSISTNTIWQIHNKYILTEITSGLIIIDQHVAHERILYESAKAAINGDGLSSQKILFPITIKFDPLNYSYLLEIMLYLKKIGFEFREFGEHTIIIEGAPNHLPLGREEEVINDIIEQYIKTKETNSSFVEYIASTYACKAAIKAGDKLNTQECKELVDQLFSTEHPYYCPHGRPIIVNLTIDDLDKRFERH